MLSLLSMDISWRWVDWAIMICHTIILGTLLHLLILWEERKVIQGEPARKIMHILAGMSPFLEYFILGIKRSMLTFMFVINLVVQAKIHFEEHHPPSSPSSISNKSNSTDRTNKRAKNVYGRPADERGAGILTFAFIYLVFFTFIIEDSVTPRTLAGFAAISCLAWGDAWASIIGSKFGKLKYIPPWYRISAPGKPKYRTIEGSITMLLNCFATISLVYYLWGSGVVASSNELYLRIILASITVTIAEACSSSDYDNIVVPVTAFLCLYI
mmetsp:Transcript_15393/g.26968  ORF Transcript_15393/g.26968 Transcript_15393/m.26968 type:complete len:270 (-) Transcript_15393:3522-4331(-)